MGEKEPYSRRSEVALAGFPHLGWVPQDVEFGDSVGRISRDIILIDYYPYSQ